MTAPAFPTIRTPRLTLRPLEQTDAAAIVAGVGNYDVSRWLAVVPYPYSLDDAQAFIVRVQAQSKPFWGVHDADGLIGVVSLDDELAYWIARPAWGRGYGFEAAHAAVEYWFKEAPQGILKSGYFDGNDRSGRVLAALGFQPQARITRYARSFRQDVVSNQMTLSPEDWAARQCFEVTTDRLKLRPLADTDADGVAAMMVPQVTTMLSTHKTGMTAREALERIHRRAWRGHLGFVLGIERIGRIGHIGHIDQKARLIGTVGIGGSPANIGYFLAPDMWGQGLMTEALSAFLPAVFKRFPLSRIEAGHFEDNPASGAILGKLGFVETARGMGTSVARVEPALLITYALDRDNLKVRSAT